jgi:hypothetical protein
MPLQYKADWEEAKLHYLAWWAGEAFGRCGLWVTAPRDDAITKTPPDPPSSPLQRWTDLDYIAALNQYQHATTYYGGEAFPMWSGGNPGHTTIGAFLGCPVTLHMDTAWLDPILPDDTWEVAGLHIDSQNRWWLLAQALMRRAAQESPGKAIPSIGAFGGCGDVLAWLRGSENLLLDVALSPERVQEAERYLLQIWLQVFNTLYGIVEGASDGVASWFPLWSSGRVFAVQNDFAYMISPRMFSAIFLPIIERQTQLLDHAVYHVDGVESFRHVPALLELPRLQAFEIRPGAGKPSALHYVDTLRLVQSKGKNLFITLPPDEVEDALRLLSARGLFIRTQCETEAQARRLVQSAERWSRDQDWRGDAAGERST